MHEPPARRLIGRKILVVEDEYLLADDLRQTLEKEGATVLGPVGHTALAHDLIDANQIDCALIDINLHGKTAFTLARLLRAKGVPLIFTTGYGKDSIPPDLQDVVCHHKPASLNTLFPLIVNSIDGNA